MKAIVDHVKLVVADLDDRVSRLEDVLGVAFDEVILDPAFGVRRAVERHSRQIELLSVVDAERAAGKPQTADLAAWTLGGLEGVIRTMFVADDLATAHRDAAAAGMNVRSTEGWLPGAFGEELLIEGAPGLAGMIGFVQRGAPRPRPGPRGLSEGFRAGELDHIGFLVD
jgi:Glyoxalase-like domain